MAYNNEEILNAIKQLLENNGTTGPTSRRTTSWGSYGRPNENTVKDAFEAQRTKAVEAFEKECEEKLKIHKQYLAEIAKTSSTFNEKINKREEENIRYKEDLEEAKLKKEQQFEKILFNEKLAQRQKLMDMSLAQHLNQLQYTQEELQHEITALKIRQQNNTLMEGDLEELAKKEEELAKAKEKELSIQKGLHELDLKQGTSKEKLIKLEQARLRYAEDIAAAEKRRDEAKLKADVDRKAGDITDDKYMQKIAEIDENFSQEKNAAQARWGRDEEGNPTSNKVIGVFGDALGEAGNSGIGNTISNVMEGVDSVKGVVSVVKEAFSGHPLGLIVKILTGLMKLIHKISKSVEEGIEEYENIQVEYLSKVNTRLDTGDLNNSRNFDNIATGFNAIFGSTKYFSQKSLIGKLGDLVDQGVVFNVEQRAILSELSKRMVDTFNMIDDHLLTLTKLQQADMSIAQLGAESLLTEFFNNTFQDNSYMTNMYDSVTSSIMNALSTMNAQDAVAFNYNVNKWLGSLYSLGMSDSGVSTLAEGINAFATGNADYFSGNDAARVLFASASEGAFADALVNGLNASNIDTLMGNIIDYLSSISADTNNVTKQVKAGIFGGLSYSDIRSVANLTVSDVQSIKNSQATWETTKQHVEDYLLDFAEQNTTLAIQMKNLVDNTKYALGENFVQNKVAYTGYKIGQFTGGWIGDALMKLSEGWGAIQIIDTLVNGVTTFNDDIATSLNRASDFTTGGVLGNAMSKLIGWLGLAPVGTVARKSYWNLADEALINGRGQSFLGKPGMSQGLSTSTTINFSSGISATNGLPLASATSINNYSDTATAATLDQTSKTVQARLHNVEGGNSTVRDINSLYQELFETQAHPIRVQVAELEDGVKTALEALTYQTTDEITHDKIDITNDRIDRLLASGAISAVFL